MKKSGAIGGVFWAFSERVCAQLISAVVTFILARLLEPSLYGTIAIVTVIIDFLNVFVTGGFSTALIQKKDADELDFNACFVLSISVAFALYLLLAVTSPWIAEFYHTPDLRPIFLVLGLRMPIAAINSIQQAMIQKRMQFRSFFWATLIGTVISAIVGIYMAYAGYGVWALVAQYMTNVVIDTIALSFLSDWHPKFCFSTERVKKIWSFGGKVLASNLISTGQNDIRSLVIGKAFGPAELSFYNHGQKYVSLIAENICDSIRKVMFPVYSEQQQNQAVLLRTIRFSVRVSTYGLTPLLMGFAIVADHFVRAILTEKWLGCVPYIRIFCVAYWIRPITSICNQGILAVGKSHIILKEMRIVNSLSMFSVFAAAFAMKNVMAVAIFWLLSELVSFFLASYYAYKLLGYKPVNQVEDVSAELLLGISMAAVVYFTGRVVKANNILVLLMQIVVGAVVYWLLSHFLRNSAYEYISKKAICSIRSLWKGDRV